MKPGFYWYRPRDEPNKKWSVCEVTQDGCVHFIHRAGARMTHEWLQSVEFGMPATMFSDEPPAG